MSRVGLCYFVDKIAKVATLIGVFKPALAGFEQIITDRLFVRFGYEVTIRLDNSVKDTPETFLQFIKSVHSRAKSVSISPESQDETDRDVINDLRSIEATKYGYHGQFGQGTPPNKR